MSAQAIRLTEVDIDNALANDHLDVVFQPIFSLEDGTLTRMEAFIRWDHPGLGVLPPGAFISFFEAQGRMGELTRHVLRRAVAAYTRWRGTTGPGFSVNLAQSDLTDPAFAADVGGILGAAGMPAGLVTLECPPLPPEMSGEEGLTHLRRLAATGCPLAAEVRGRAPDFLRDADPFPFAEIKTGGSTILRFARTARGGPGLEAISDLVDLAARHEARIVAVGVEDEEAATALRRLGFGAAQGNLLAGATALDAFSAQTINAVRGTLGLEPMSQEALGEAVGRNAEPLVLRAAQPAPEAAPEGPADATALAIQRLKARKIAAKRAALRQAQEARARAEAEVDAAKQASDTARRLQERLAAEIEENESDAAPTSADAAPVALAEPETTEPEQAVAPGEPLAAEAAEAVPARAEMGEPDENRPGDPAASQPPVGIAASAPVSPAEPAATPSSAAGDSADDEDDDEAGTLLSDHLAETALGVSQRPSFADGIRLDGYASGASGAVAPDAEPAVRAGQAEAEPFSAVTEAIHRILDELPVPEAAKPALRHSAVKPLTLADLEADKSPEDALDEVVAAIPVLSEEAPAAPAAPADDLGTAQAPVRAARPRRKNLLTRRYRITHFWPRSWVRAVRRAQAARAARLAVRMDEAGLATA